MVRTRKGTGMSLEGGSPARANLLQDLDAELGGNPNNQILDDQARAMARDRNQDGRFQAPLQNNVDLGEVMLNFENSHAQLMTDLQRWNHNATEAFSGNIECRINARFDAMNHEVSDIMKRFQQDILRQQSLDNNATHDHVQETQRNLIGVMRENNENLIGELRNLHHRTDESVQKDTQFLVDTLRKCHGEMMSAMQDTNQEVAQSITTLANSVTRLTESMTESQAMLLQQIQKKQESQTNPSHTKTEDQIFRHERADTPYPKTKLHSSSRNRELFDSDDSKKKHKHKSKTKSTKYDSSDHGSSEPSSSSDSDTDSSSSDQKSHLSNKSNRHQREHKKHRKIPTFNGDRKFGVWYNQFKDNTKDMSNKEKLKEMKSLLRGDAAEFVYDQLAAKTRKDYNALKHELKHRFRKVENPKTFAAMFSKRNQKANETVEEYSAELKRLYNKAHPGRDEETRQDDLLRRFLDGLVDREASSQVEYIKQPTDIDTAVEETVHFQQLHKPSKSRVARNRYSDSSDNEYDSEEIRYFKGPGRPNRQFQRYPPNQKFQNQKYDHDKKLNPETTSGAQANATMQNELQQSQPQSQTQTNWQQNIAPNGSFQPGQNTNYQNVQNTGDQPSYASGQYYQNRPYNAATRPPIKCFRCDQFGHTKQNCTAVLMVYPGNQPPFQTSPVGQNTVAPLVQNPVSATTTTSQNSVEAVVSNSSSTAPPVQTVHQVQQQTIDQANQVWAPITSVPQNMQMQMPPNGQENSGVQSN